MTDDDVLGWSGPFLVVRDIDGVRHAIRHTWIAGIREVGAGEDVTLIVTKFGTVTVPKSFQSIVEAIRQPPLASNRHNRFALPSRLRPIT